ncbi:uncharacterized protein LOC121656371 [Melanotaenia boesemani]|uniref:uncharacterized protein LOC121656371 n=1 Tax=Melanotaenia boesemani TaxID=1250792 RepID=UPI001C056029|nr:uncharacterized protein LOC121656371 [Melanotaenia boesemani]
MEEAFEKKRAKYKELAGECRTVELTVIPSGTKIQNVAERSTISLKCHHEFDGSHVPTWSREIAGKQQHISPNASTLDKKLTIRNVQHGDFGLYHCDGKPVIYLNVTKDERSDRGHIDDGGRGAVISGVVIVVLLVAICVVTGLVLYLKRRQKQQAGNPLSSVTTSSVMDRGRSDGSNMENMVYENCTPSACEDSTYESLNPASQDHNQIYCTLTEHA